MIIAVIPEIFVVFRPPQTEQPSLCHDGIGFVREEGNKPWKVGIRCDSSGQIPSGKFCFEVNKCYQECIIDIGIVLVVVGHIVHVDSH